MPGVYDFDVQIREVPDVPRGELRGRLGSGLIEIKYTALEIFLRQRVEGDLEG